MSERRADVDELRQLVKEWMEMPCAKDVFPKQSNFARIHERTEDEHMDAEALGLADWLVTYGWRKTVGQP